jgi:hypothetical protein
MPEIVQLSDNYRTDTRPEIKVECIDEVQADNGPAAADGGLIGEVVITASEIVDAYDDSTEDEVKPAAGGDDDSEDDDEDEAPNEVPSAAKSEMSSGNLSDEHGDDDEGEEETSRTFPQRVCRF